MAEGVKRSHSLAYGNSLIVCADCVGMSGRCDKWGD